MEQEYSNETLGVMLKDLKEVTEKGFAGVHKRQDKTNGKVRSLEVWRGFLTGGMLVIGVVVGYIISFIK